MEVAGGDPRPAVAETLKSEIVCGRMDETVCKGDLLQVWYKQISLLAPSRWLRTTLDLSVNPRYWILDSVFCNAIACYSLGGPSL